MAHKRETVCGFKLVPLDSIPRDSLMIVSVVPPKAKESVLAWAQRMVAEKRVMKIVGVIEPKRKRAVSGRDSR